MGRLHERGRVPRAGAWRHCTRGPRRTLGFTRARDGLALNGKPVHLGDGPATSYSHTMLVAFTCNDSSSRAASETSTKRSMTSRGAPHAKERRMLARVA